MTSLTEIIQAAPPNGNIRVEFKKASAVAAEEVTFCQDLWMSRLLRYKTFARVFVKTFGCQDFCKIRLFAKTFACQDFCNIRLLQHFLSRPLDVKTFAVTMKASDILIARLSTVYIVIFNFNLLSSSYSSSSSSVILLGKRQACLCETGRA